jgi:signal transduction histidine kinase
MEKLAPDTISTGQLAALRRMLCGLACRPGADQDEKAGQALDGLIEAIGLQAAGFYWAEGEQFALRVCRPTGYPLGERLQQAALDKTRLKDIIQDNDERAAWLIAPMRAEGVTLGRLWAAAPPGRRFGDGEREMLILAAHQLALALHSGALLNELERMAERRGALLRQYIELHESCSQTVSRELHDEISQSLTALILEADIALAADADEPARRRLAHLRQGVVRVLDEVNRIVLDLRPTLLETHGLMAALSWYAVERLTLARTQVHITGGRCAPRLPSPLLTILYRVGQQALSNAALHAAAQNVWLDISCCDNHVTLTVRDDGRGFDARQALAHQQGLKGFGLWSMQERAALVDGQLSIESQPVRGTSISLKIPFACKIADDD